MNRLCKTERLSAGRDEDVARAAEILRAGGTVAFATETVYGLGANALDQSAVARIFDAKQRPAWDPLIVHVSDRTMLAKVADIPPEFAQRVQALSAAFWPGPLTMLLPRTQHVPDLVTAGRPLVGVRMPSHPSASLLIRTTRLPLAAPSANRFGRTSPTTAAHVLEDLDGRIDAVLDGGPTPVGIESTVLAVAQTPMIIYRPGAVTAAMIAAVTGLDVNLFQPPDADASRPPKALPSPGVGLRHYAPRARLLLVDVPATGDPTHCLHAAIESFEKSDAFEQTNSDGLVGVMLPEGWDASYAEETVSLGQWGDHDDFARRLFAAMRELDRRGVAVIVCPLPAGEGLAAALRDRLQKAARRG